MEGQIDCTEVSRLLETEVKSAAESFREKRGRAPRLALVCANDGSEQQATELEQACKEAGIATEVQRFGNGGTARDVMNYIRVLNADSGTEAIALCGRQENGTATAVDFRKDANRIAVPRAVIEALEKGGVSLEGKHIVIINRSRRIGLPLAKMLLDKNATVTICHTKTFDLSWHTSQADILITAAGKPGLVSGGMVKEGAIIVDLGGDTDAESMKEKERNVIPFTGCLDAVAAAVILKNAAEIFSNGTSR